MHQMTQFRNSCQRQRIGGPSHRLPWAFAALSAVLAAAVPAAAQSLPPHGAQASPDFEASGYVVPAGMVSPEQYPSAGPQVPSSGPYPLSPGMDDSGVAPAGYMSGCDGGCFDSGQYGGTGDCSCAGGGGCGLLGGGGCGLLGGGGIRSRLRSLHYKSGFDDLCYLFGGVPMTLRALLPYSEAGQCAQRWYDVSAEATYLGHNRLGPSRTVTTLGTGLDNPVLNLADVGSTDLEAGFRLSAAMIFGPGGNLEVTYIGNNDWHQRAAVTDPDAGLFSFISEFGTAPLNGFDDTDRSLRQSLDMESTFHSGEVNYRRRTVGPNCRFQASWLVGLRYLRYDNGLLYAALGEEDNTVNEDLPRFFSTNDVVKNDLAGAQIGGDLWWNVIPGVNLGVGAKGAWLNNDIDRRTTLTANSIDAGGAGEESVTSGGSDSTVAGELEATAVYRLSHSWSLRSSYYLLAIEDVAVGTADAQTVRGFVQEGPAPEPDLVHDRLVIQGVTFGAEYLW